MRNPWGGGQEGEFLANNVCESRGGGQQDEVSHGRGCSPVPVFRMTSGRSVLPLAPVAARPKDQQSNRCPADPNGDGNGEWPTRREVLDCKHPWLVVVGPVLVPREPKTRQEGRSDDQSPECWPPRVPHSGPVDVHAQQRQLLRRRGRTPETAQTSQNRCHRPPLVARTRIREGTTAAGFLNLDPRCKAT